VHIRLFPATEIKLYFLLPKFAFQNNNFNQTVACKAPEMLLVFAMLHSNKKKKNHTHDMCFPSGFVVLGEWVINIRSSGCAC